MKKIFAALFSVLIIAGCSFSALACETEIIPFDDFTPTVCTKHMDSNNDGECDYCNRVLADVNNDGKVDIRDLVILKKILANVEGAKTEYTVQDINCDGNENSDDLTMLTTVILNL